MSTDNRFNSPATVAGFTFDSVLEGRFECASRRFQLTKPLSFHSSKYLNPLTNSYLWTISIGSWMDGASIPKSCWSIVGAPYSGSYRKSAGIHDVLCDTRGWNLRVSSSVVHDLFAEMIYAEGVRGWKHYAMSKAVKWGGPKW